VLFHPRRRQSSRTAKTYHTIVSKFAHSPISRSFLSRSPLPLLPPLSSSITHFLLSSLSLVSLRLFVSFLPCPVSHHDSSSLVSPVLRAIVPFIVARFYLRCIPGGEVARGTRRTSFPLSSLSDQLEDIGVKCASRRNDLKVGACRCRCARLLSLSLSLSRSLVPRIYLVGVVSFAQRASRDVPRENAISNRIGSRRE